jgi:hypothetical protein
MTWRKNRAEFWGLLGEGDILTMAVKEGLLETVTFDKDASWSLSICTTSFSTPLCVELRVLQYLWCPHTTRGPAYPWVFALCLRCLFFYPSWDFSGSLWTLPLNFNFT